MSVLPPPAATVVRVLGDTVRLGLASSAAASSPSLHLLAGAVTRCGHRTSTDWQAYAGAEAPPLRLCRRCLAGLPAEVRTKLVPTSAELAALYERQARAAVDELVALLAHLRTESLIDGAAYERTAVVEAHLEVPEATHDRWGTRTMTRRQMDALPGPRHIAKAREVTLLDLINASDPSRPDLPFHRVWLGLEAPEPGATVDIGGTYDARTWMGRKR